MISVLLWSVFSYSRSNKEVKHKVITLAGRTNVRYSFLHPKMRRWKSCRFPYGMHTPLQHENNLWSISFAFCLTNAQHCLSSACKETLARACRGQQTHLSCSITSHGQHLHMGRVVGCILMWAAWPLCRRGGKIHISRVERSWIQDKRRFKVWDYRHL